jgi:hypothetical protein
MKRNTMTCDIRRTRRFRALKLLPVLLICCTRLDSADLAGTGLESVLKIPTSLHRKLVENSIAVTSVSQPGIIFGMNDSGNDPFLFAFDSTGRQRGAWRVTRSANLDWEAAALGPCRPDDNAMSCLYIGDVGDNDAGNDHVSVYRVKEPDVPATIPDAPIPIAALDRLDPVTGPVARREAMYVAPDGALFRSPASSPRR